MVEKNKVYLKFLLSLILLATTGVCIYLKYTNQYVFLIWILSIFLLLKSFSFHFSKNSVNKFLSIFNSKSFLFVTIIFFTFRFLILSQSKMLRIHHDCAILAYHSYKLFLSFIQTGNLNMLGGSEGPLTMFPSFWYCLNGFIMYLFGYNIYSSKILGISNDFCIFLCLWIIGVSFFKSKKLAIASSFAYATFFPAIYYSNTIYNNLESSLFYILSIILYIHAEKNNFREWLLLGVIVGFSLYFYLASIILPIIILMFISFYFIIKKCKDLKKTIKNIFYFTLGYLFSSLPYWVFSLCHYNFFVARANGVYVTQEYQRNFFGFLFEQSMRIINGFNKWNFDGAGMHYIGMSLFNSTFIYVLFIIGFLIAICSFRCKEKFVFVIVFVVNFVLGGLLTENPPASHRLLPFLWISCFFIGLAIIFISDILSKIFNKIKIKNIGNVTIIVMLSFILYFNIITYKKGIEILKDNKDPLVEFIPIYEKQKLPVYGVTPPHAPFILSLYLGDFNFKINELYQKGVTVNPNVEHYVIIENRNRNSFYKVKKQKNIKGKYKKILEIKNVAYRVYRSIK